jgi:isopenicillin N synthase-like dioxygenase
MLMLFSIGQWSASNFNNIVIFFFLIKSMLYIYIYIILYVRFREVALEYLKTSMKLARKLVEILIGKLGVTLDDSRMNGLMGLKMVNMNFYPTCPNPELTVGVGRHSDMGTLTVLLQDGIGGLYVKIEEDIDAGNKGEWMEIPPIPGALLINVGDALQVNPNIFFFYKIILPSLFI